MRQTKRVLDEASEASTLPVDDAAQADEIARLQSALDTERARVLRLRADIENMRRRAGRELETASLEGRRSALLPVLVVLDALERALAAGSPEGDLYEGVVATHRLFEAALREAGAERIDTQGRPFDPKFHEAVAAAPAPGIEPGTVTRELQSGWSLGGELLRPAQVEVAGFAEEPDAELIDWPARDRG